MNLPKHGSIVRIIMLEFDKLLTLNLSDKRGIEVRVPLGEEFKVLNAKSSPRLVSVVRSSVQTAKDLLKNSNFGLGVEFDYVERMDSSGLKALFIASRGAGGGLRLLRANPDITTALTIAGYVNGEAEPTTQKRDSFNLALRIPHAQIRR